MQHSIPTGQWFVSNDGQRWWFDTGSVALDFAYTGAFEEGREALNSAEDLATWLGDRFPEVDSTVETRDLNDAKALRASVAHLATAASTNATPPAQDVDVINLFAATPDIPPTLEGGTRKAGRSRARAGQALAAMAREAVELFTAAKQERIRECAADDCRLIFYDESRSNNRRWCSMQRCGNRAKVRAHRERSA